MARLGVVLLVLASVGVALSLVEVGLRLLPDAASRRGHLTTDPVLHHRLRPNVATRVRGVEFATNSLGLRGGEIAPVKASDTFRVLMLGDSFTEGGGLRLEDTVATRVEAMLNAGPCRGRVEIVNGGVGSYSPILEYLFLKTVGLGLGPDLLVLNFDMTDVHDDYIRTVVARLAPDGLPLAVPSDRRRETAVLLPPLAKPRALDVLDPLERLVDRLAVWQLVRKSRVGETLFGSLKLTEERLEALHAVGDVRYDIMAPTREGDSPRLREAWRLTERYLTAIHRLARERGIPFVLVAYPHPHQVSASESPEGRKRFGVGPGLYASEAPFRILADLGRREGFPVVSLLGLFRERSATEGPLFWPDDIHHNPQGARVFAEGVSRGLLASGLLPQCRAATNKASSRATARSQSNAVVTSFAPAAAIRARRPASVASRSSFAARSATSRRRATRAVSPSRA
jgi:lysophospholipase L1-like esterase